jgi:hypothetical protein
MKKWARRGLILGLLGGAVLLLLLQPTPWLILEEDKTGLETAAIPLAWGECFEIRYIHSVDRKPVGEIFSLQEGKGVVLQESYFRMFGAGMGHWEGHGKLEEEGGWMRIREIDKPLGSFLLRVGSPGVDHTLVVKGEKMNLTRTAEGKLLRVRLGMRPRILALLHTGRPQHGG